MSLNNFNFTQQGTLWVVADNGVADKDVNLTISVGSSEIFAPYNIRSGVIAPSTADTYSVFTVFACAADGSPMSDATLPIESMTITSSTINPIISFTAQNQSIGSNAQVAGFGITFCVWSQKTNLANGSYNVMYWPGTTSGFSSYLAMRTHAATIKQALLLESNVQGNLVPWGTGQGTETGL